MEKFSGYRALCGITGALFAVAGLVCFVGFFRAQVPGGEVGGPIPLGIGGVYFLAFTGCALVGWGGALIGAARQPRTHRTVGTATALALVLMAVYRIAAWFLGDYAFLGDLLRVEAAVLLVLAFGFVWLRPPAVHGVLRWLATAVVVALLALDIFLPYTPLGRRGPEAQQRADVAGVAVRVGEPVPDLALRTLEGAPLSLADFRGHPLLVTFERSVDW